MIKSLIDMSRPHMLYVSGVGIIMLFSLATSNVAALSFSAYFDFSFRRQLCALLYLGGASLGAWAIHRHMLRAKTPWKIPQSQVTLPYAGFFVTTLLAIALSH
jgi:hypothetical protein